jgi:hypothetical protein
MISLYRDIVAGHEGAARAAATARAAGRAAGKIPVR